MRRKTIIETKLFPIGDIWKGLLQSFTPFLMLAHPCSADCFESLWTYAYTSKANSFNVIANSFHGTKAVFLT